MTVFYALHNDSQLGLARRVFLEPTEATVIDGDSFDPYNPYDNDSRILEDCDTDCAGCGGCCGCDECA